MGGTSRGVKTVCLVLLLGQLLAVKANAASIVGSRHDLSALYQMGSGTGLSHNNSELWSGWADYQEVCVYCHTPHHADQVQGPLWNRTANTTSYQLYSSGNVQPGELGQSSLMCLSCHDGTISVDAVLNMPGSGLQKEWYNPGAIYPAGDAFMNKEVMFHDGKASCNICHPSDGGPTGINLSDAFITTDLGDEHPVGITYASQPDLVPPPGNGIFPNGVRLIEGRVECLSCHQPHDPAYRPFLATDNGGSALCLTCHLK